MNGMEVLEIKKEAAKRNLQTSSGAKEIWELSSSSSRSWDRFVAEFLIAIGGDQKKDYVEDCFPTTMISENCIDKIYNCYDR